MFTSRSHALAALALALILAAACTPTTPEPGITPSSPTPEVIVVPVATEEILISTEDIPQPNCDGGGEMSATVERSHTVSRTLDLGTSITVDAYGQANISPIGQVGVGVAVATYYQVSYGSEDMVTRSTTVKANAGTNILHTIRQYEIWETGELVITAGGINQRLPYRFRKDFSMETLPPANIGCPGQDVQSPPVDAGTGDGQASGPAEPLEPTAAPQPGPSSGVTAAQLDGLFGSGNWFCFPDRTNGVGVKSLPVNFAVVDPLRYIDTFRGRFSVGQTEVGATGATAELTSALPPGQCPGWQQGALSSWAASRSSGQQISSGSQLDSIFGAGNWGCLTDYPFGARVFFYSSDFQIEYPFTTVDINDGSKHGVGEAVNPNGEMTVWFAGSVNCP